MNPVFPSMILCEWQEHKGAYLLLCTPTTLLYACAYKLQQHIVLLKLCRAPRWKPLPLSSCSPEFAQNTLKYIEAWLLLPNSCAFGFDLLPARFDPQISRTSHGDLRSREGQSRRTWPIATSGTRSSLWSSHQLSTTCESDKSKSSLHLESNNIPKRPEGEGSTNERH